VIELPTFSTDLKFEECFKRFVVECEFVENTLFYDYSQRARERRQTCIFLKFNLSQTTVF